MGKARKTRKIAAVKRVINPNDARLKTNPTPAAKNALAQRKSNSLSTSSKTTIEGEKIRSVTKLPTQLFFRYNTALGPPYQILIDTNFINFSIQNKLDIFQSMMDCLLSKCTGCITDCVMAELEKLGGQYRVALKIAKDSRFERLPCTHKGTYADDCLVRRVTAHKCYIVATCDRDLKRRIRKIPGVPIMYITQHKFSIERFPDVNNAPRNG